jgi:hypothetical protein
MKLHHLISSAFALGVVSIATVANASSHREAPAIAYDPAADNTDLWAWTPTSHDSLNIVASYIPLEEPAGAPNYHKFSDDVLYEIHIARGPTSLADAITYQIRFSTAKITRVDPAAHGPAGGGKEFYAQISGYFNQTYTVTKIVAGQAPVVVVSNVDVAPPNVGPRTTAAWKVFGFYPKGGGAVGVLGATPTYDDTFANSFIKDTGAQGKFWAGPRDDGFFVDLGRTFDLASFANPAFPGYDANPKDNVAGYNCHTISMEIPAMAILGHSPGVAGNADTVGVWASASRRKDRTLRNDGTEDLDGPWVQVSRLGFPLVNEAIVGIQDKDKYNRNTPSTDLTNIGPYILNPVVAIDALTVGAIPQATADVSSGKNGARTDIVDVLNIKNFPTANAHSITSVGDVLRVDMGADPGFPNGRPLPDGTITNVDTPVTDIELSLLILGPGQLSGIAQGATHNDKNYPGAFPYLPLPWAGSNEGHGVAP